MIVILKVLLIAGLIGLNAFFVAAEYSLLSVRRSRLEQLVVNGHPRARLVQVLLANIGLLFSGIQLGITIASLLMGWLGEAILAAAIRRLLEDYLSRYAAVVVAHGISIAIAFLMITALLMVLGELVPKALAYERAEQVSLLVARPLLFFMRLSSYPVRALDAMANAVLRSLGAPPGSGHGLLHTPEEVKLIVSAIRRRGLLDEEQEDMIRSVFDLHQVRVREIMVPWPKVTSYPLAGNLIELLERMVKDQHSRVPIYDELPDQIIGILYAKDLLDVVLSRLHQRLPLDAPLDLRPILHQPLIVPETVSVSHLLEEVRRRQSQMALVVDEFGTFVGLVTIEDVLEQIVGEIHDEYDKVEAVIRKVGENEMVVDASVSLRDLADDYDILLPREPGIETLAGFVLARLGSIPRGGEAFIFEGRRYTVAEMDQRRVAKVKIERLPESPARETADTALPDPSPAEGKQ
jgi:putative hemolysin